MATYKVTDPISGKTVQLTGDSPPTEKELEGIFSSIGGDTAPTPAPASFFDKVKDVLRQGVNASGAESDVLGGSAQNLTMENTGRPLIDSAMRTLPVIGATGGAIIGAPAVATGPWGAAVPVAGATLGGAAGSALEDVLRRLTGIGPQPTTPGLNPLKSAAEMGTWEAGAPGLMALLSKAGAPFAKTFQSNQAAQDIYKVATENNLPMSPSTILPTKTAQAIEGVVNLFPTGKAVTTKYQNDLYRWLLNSRPQFIEELTGKGGAEGTSFIRGAGESQVAAKKAAKESYASITQSAGGNETIIPMQNTKQYFDEIYDVAPPKIKQLIDDFKTRIIGAGEAGGGVGMTAKDFDEFHSLINKKGAGMKENINSRVDKDITLFDEAGGNKVMDAVKESATKWRETKNYEFLSGIFQKSTRVGNNGEEVFSPGIFYKIVMNPNNQLKFEKEFGKSALENMKDYAELTLKIGEEYAKKEGSKMGDAVRLTLTGGSIAAPFYNPSLLVPYGVAPMLAWQMMKPRTVFKKWLTEGLGMTEGVKEGLKVGGRAAIAQENE